MKEALIIFIIIYLIPLLCYVNLKNKINNYKDNKNKKNLSGFEVSRNILDKNKLDNMYIVEKRGNLTDIYDSNQKVVRLSTTTFHDETLYSMLTASYISSHAILNKKNSSTYFKLLLNPLFNYITYAIYILLIAGLCLENTSIIYISIALLIITIIYHVIIGILDQNIIKNSIDNLNKLKYLNKENIDDISSINNLLKTYNMSNIILCLIHLFYNIKDLIDNAKKG